MLLCSGHPLAPAMLSRRAGKVAWNVSVRAMIPCRRQLVSASHDNTLKLWDLGFLLDDEDSQEEESEAEEAAEAEVSSYRSAQP